VTLGVEARLIIIIRSQHFCKVMRTTRKTVGPGFDGLFDL